MYTSACMIRIMYRDLNGKRSSHVCKGYDAAYSFARDNLSEEEEIQLVYINDQCVYSSLQGNPITNEDLVAFFA
ncbi:MAG: hypothetical protein IKA36_06020 [Clostridia bacterium]|nr:hypothetical protein [Clostridia bacterium]